MSCNYKYYTQKLKRFPSHFGLTLLNPNRKSNIVKEINFLFENCFLFSMLLYSHIMHGAENLTFKRLTQFCVIWLGYYHTVEPLINSKNVIFLLGYYLDVELRHTFHSNVGESKNDVR